MPGGERSNPESAAYIEMHSRRDPVVSNSRKASVTIGIPVFNGGQFLTAALESLLSQSFEDIHIIVSDNASIDDTESISRRFACADPRVSYYRQSRNMGAVHNFATVLNCATSPYFMWARSRDLWHRTWIEECVGRFEDDRRIAAVSSYTTLIDQHGSSVEDKMNDQLEAHGQDVLERYRNTLCRLSWGNMVYGVLRTKWAKSVGGLKNVWWSDQLFLASLALYGPLVQIPNHLYFRRNVRPPENAEEKDRRQAVAMDPDSADAVLSTPLILRQYELYCEHLGAIENSPLSKWDKLKCKWTLTEYFLLKHAVEPAGIRMARKMQVGLFLVLFERAL